MMQGLAIILAPLGSLQDWASWKPSSTFFEPYIALALGSGCP